jgi:hypothetical protein
MPRCWQSISVRPIHHSVFRVTVHSLLWFTETGPSGRWGPSDCKYDIVHVKASSMQDFCLLSLAEDTDLLEDTDLMHDTAVRLYLLALRYTTCFKVTELYVDANI